MAGALFRASSIYLYQFEAKLQHFQQLAKERKTNENSIPEG